MLLGVVVTGAACVAVSVACQGPDTILTVVTKQCLTIHHLTLTSHSPVLCPSVLACCINCHRSQQAAAQLCRANSIPTLMQTSPCLLFKSLGIISNWDCSNVNSWILHCSLFAVPNAILKDYNLSSLRRTLTGKLPLLHTASIHPSQLPASSYSNIRRFYLPWIIEEMEVSWRSLTGLFKTQNESVKSWFSTMCLIKLQFEF